MRLSLKGVAISFAIVWAGGVLCVGLANLVAPTYGTTFLQMASSIYPGFHNSHTILDVIVGTLYAAVDGAFGGAVFAWLYNLIVARSV